MFLYDWNKIYKSAEGNTTECVRIFKMLAYKHIPVNYKDKTYKYSSTNFSGVSFLLHPDVLALEAYKYSNKEVCQYLALASLRPLPDYLAFGTTDLDLITVPIEPNLFNQNRLLRIENDILSFCLEEVPTEKH